MMNDSWPKHQLIPMEKFELGQKYKVRLLYYHNPSRFSVYLPQKLGPLTEFQTELQHAMLKHRSTSSITNYQIDQAVATEDNHNIWHRATVLQRLDPERQVRVYFVDVGFEETLSIEKIRPLPHEFFRQAAFAIPCRLYQIHSRNTSSQTAWPIEDPVHHEFGQLKKLTLTLKVHRIEENSFYEVHLDVEGIGDFGNYLREKNLVSRSLTTMTTTTTTTVQRFPTASISSRLVREIPKPQTISPDDGQYIITRVHSALEFYGYSQRRQRELDQLQKHFETMFNSNQNQSLTVNSPINGTFCVVQQGEKYHRVQIKHRETESRVLVKLIDRGDEILVDSSELIRLDDKLALIPIFAQPFRLFSFDETQSSATLTRKLKNFLLNQRVQIKLHLPMINGFYPVEISFPDGTTLDERLHSPEMPRPPSTTITTRHDEPFRPVFTVPRPSSTTMRDDEPYRPSPEVSRPSSTMTAGTFAELPPPTRTLTATNLFQTTEQRPTRFPNRNFRSTHRPPPIRREFVEPTTDFSGPKTMRRESFESASTFPDEILPQDQFEFAISHFEEINDFFIQNLLDANELSTLNNELQKESSETFDLPEKMLKEDFPCLAKSFDNCWYRAQILSISDKTVKVRFVDFGDTMEIEKKKIRQLPKKFSSKPPYAHRCSLNDVQNVESRKIDEKFRNSFASSTFRGEFVDKSILVSKELKNVLVGLNAVRTILKGSVVYIDASQNEFFVQTNPKVVEQIQNLIKNESTSFVRPEEIRVGLRVIATFDRASYRAEIIGTNENQSDCEVLFIDFGNRSRILKSILKNSSKKLDSFPRQARRCRSTARLDVEHGEIEIEPINENDESLVQIFQDESFNSTMTTVKERRKVSKGTLTFFDEIRSTVFIQTDPNAEVLLERIDEQIDQIIREDRRLSSYKIGDRVVAKFSEDELFYRANVEKISNDNRIFTVFFIDYGNRDENVTKNDIFSSTKELQEILPLAEEYSLEKLDENLRQWLKTQQNQLVDFELVDQRTKRIRFEFNEKQVETFSGTISGVHSDRFYVHRRPNCDALICEMEELIESLEKVPSNGRQWNLNDLCLVYDLNEDKNRRGKILNIDNELQRYDVQCIDYGYVLSDLEEKDLFQLENSEFFQRKPLAQVCRLFGVSPFNQRLANDELLRHIPSTETVMITVQKINEQNEMLVMLFRENHVTVNDIYQSKNSIENVVDAHMTSLIGIPQAESTHQFADFTQRSFSMTIDFGENDQSTTMIRELDED